jgi:hypothetical protein
MFDMRKCRIDTVNTINHTTLRYLLVSLILLVGIPLFAIPTLVANGYNVYGPIAAMAIIYGTIISYVIVTNYKCNM